MFADDVGASAEDPIGRLRRVFDEEGRAIVGRAAVEEMTLALGGSGIPSQPDAGVRLRLDLVEAHLESGVCASEAEPIELLELSRRHGWSQ